MRKLWLLAFIAFAACGIDRPEGVVERWLTSASQGPTGDPAAYADDSLTDQIVPPPREDGALEVIEVGRGRISGSAALVPFRVVSHSGDEIERVAELRRVKDGWTILRMTAPAAGLAVPTQGGERIGRAKTTDWLAATGAALLLVLITVGLMKLVTPRVN